MRTIAARHWLQQVQNGQPRIEMFKNMIRSVEFANIHATENDTQFVTSVYWSFHGRAPDAAGLAYWLNDLANGQTRVQVAINVVLGDEFRFNLDHNCLYL